jgi:hypothetical protein
MPKLRVVLAKISGKKRLIMMPPVRIIMPIIL